MPTNTPWTTEEENLVRSLWATHTSAQIAGQMNGRTPTAVKARGFVLGLLKHVRTWTPEEDAYVKAHYAATEDDVMAAHLNVTMGAVRSRAYLLNCKKDAAYRTAKILQGMKARPGKKSKVKHARSTIKNGKKVKVKELPTGTKPWEHPMNSPQYKAWMESHTAGKKREYGIDSMNRPTVRYVSTTLPY